jgi:hypothetical protein
MGKHPKLLFGLKALQFALFLWIMFTISPKLIPSKFQTISHFMIYTSIMIGLMNVFFLSFISLGGVRITGFVTILWSVVYFGYTVYLSFQVLGDCGEECIDPSLVMFFSVQSAVTLLMMLILSLMWSFVLARKITFQSLEQTIDEIEFGTEIELIEPLPLYTKSELPTYDEAFEIPNNGSNTPSPIGIR